jgi:hypothetical protein
MTCLKVVRSAHPDQRVLPIFYSDNYVSLLPHEKRDLRVDFDPAALNGEQPRLLVNGWNVAPFEINL